ncbi:ABC transporter permease subunit [Exiguobacterium flavidum]|uniref:ABC transporter permease subunit n=1 Tax=Exiguobacterium flavidum TaxID=2184695 RepID=UPI000DF7891A|nr:ABC transporter permease subunit [Exiguobacterium flavidum]
MYKQLFRHQLKQAVFPIIGFILLAVFAYGFGAFNLIESLKDSSIYGDAIAEPYLITQVLVNPIFTGGAAVLIAIFSILLIGAERGSGRSGMLHALPFPRRSLFFIKWLIGAGLLLVIPLIGLGVSAFLLQVIGNIPLGDWTTPVQLAEMFAYHYLFDLAVFSLFLLAGTLAGDVIGQLLIGLFLVFFNLLTVGVIFAVVSAGLEPNSVMDEQIERFVEPLMTTFSLFTLFGVDQAIFERDFPTVPSAVYAICLTLVATLLAAYLYPRVHNEMTGRFTVFPRLRKPIVLIFSLYAVLLLGAFVSLFASFQGMITQMFYWLAVLILAWPVFLAFRRLVGWRH